MSRLLRGKNPELVKQVCGSTPIKKEPQKRFLLFGPGGSRTHGRQGLGNLRSILLSYRAIYIQFYHKDGTARKTCSHLHTQTRHRFSRLHLACLRSLGLPIARGKALSYRAIYTFYNKYKNYSRVLH